MTDRQRAAFWLGFSVIVLVSIPFVLQRLTLG